MAAVLVGGAFGAVIGASVNPSPGNPFQADAIIAVEPSAGAPSPSDIEQGWRAVTDAVALPQVAQRVSDIVTSVGASAVPGRLQVLGDPGSGLARVRARGGSPTEAMALANAAAGQAVLFLRRIARANLNRDTPQSRFGFERGTDGWTPGSVFSTPASRLAVARGGAYAGGGALRFTCPATAAIGCGPGVSLAGPFDPGVAYSARGYVRALTGGSSVRLVLGTGSGDVSTGPPTAVGATYAALNVVWIPNQLEASSTLAMQTTTRGAAAVLLDSVTVDQSVATAGDAATTQAAQRDAVAARAQRAVAADRFIDVGGATSVADVADSTGRSTLVGALAGAVAGFAAWFFARAATARGNRQAEDDPDAQI